MLTSILRHVVVLTFASLIGAGCIVPARVELPVAPQAQPPAPNIGVVPSTAKPPVPPVARFGYYAFTEDAHQNARTSQTPILLYFYANWCPFCLEQDPRLVALFNKDPMGIVTFRVNWQDSDTDANEKQLARQFNITYQHTFVMLDKYGKEVARATGTLSDEKVKDLIQQGK